MRLVRNQLIQFALVLTAVALTGSFLSDTETTQRSYDKPISALRPRPPKSARSYTRITTSFVGVDRAEALKRVAKLSGRNAYIATAVSGQITMSFENTPADEAFRKLLADLPDLEFKFLEGSTQRAVVVATRAQLDEIDDSVGSGRNVALACVPESPGRMEFLLEEAPSAKVVDCLSEHYERVKFTPHPTNNGFYAVGTREDLLQIKRDLQFLDRPLPPPQIPERGNIVLVRHLDIHGVRERLSAAVPHIIHVDSRLKVLVVEGPPEAQDQVRDLVAQWDRPTDEEPSQ